MRSRRGLCTVCLWVGSSHLQACPHLLSDPHLGPLGAVSPGMLLPHERSRLKQDPHYPFRFFVFSRFRALETSTPGARVTAAVAQNPAPASRLSRVQPRPSPHIPCSPLGPRGREPSPGSQRHHITALVAQTPLSSPLSRTGEPWATPSSSLSISYQVTALQPPRLVWGLDQVGQDEGDSLLFPVSPKATSHSLSGDPPLGIRSLVTPCEVNPRCPMMACGLSQLPWSCHACFGKNSWSFHNTSCVPGSI